MALRGRRIHHSRCEKMGRRVGASAEQMTSAEPALARTVYALRDRGLVEVLRRAGGWTTQLTEAGRFYLEYGHHPERPSNRGTSGAPSDRGVAEVARLEASMAPVVWDGRPRPRRDVVEARRRNTCHVRGVRRSSDAGAGDSR